MDPIVAAARDGQPDAFERIVAKHRRELRAHCYRLCGSLEEADELLQESLLRAWRGISGFEGRASVRTWLFRVTTHTCLDALDRARAQRRLPFDLGPAGAPSDIAGPRADVAWLGPCPDGVAVDASPSPESVVSARESVSLAFLVALQALPPKQRAVLLLRDVVGLEATEVATELDLSVAAVTSALQRARDKLATRPTVDPTPPPELLARYVSAWERADVDALVALLREDASLAMPPIPVWVRGRAAIAASLRGMVLPPDAAGRFRLAAVAVNGRPGFAMYAGPEPRSIHVLDVVEGAIASIVAFSDPVVAARFVADADAARGGMP